MLKMRGLRQVVEQLERRVLLAAVPVGPEFQVNTYTTNHQRSAQMAMNADGDFVIVWQSRYQDGSGDGVYAQRYNAAGVPQGSEFRVNTYTTDWQRVPSVAMDADGNFVIAWTSTSQDGSGDGVYAQRYDAAGVPQGSEFRVNTYTTDPQFLPSVAMDADGDFIIAWGSNGQDGSGHGVYAQRYNFAGVPQGSEFRVNSYTTNSQLRPSVAMDADGNFLIAWQSYDQDGSGSGVYAQRYNAAGVPLESEFRVNTSTTGSQWYPAVAMDADGDFVIAWESFSLEGSGADLYAQRYDSAGVPQGGEFRVNTYTTDHQFLPSVAMDADGDFVIAWYSRYQDGSLDGVYAQRYNGFGVPQGSEFRVNSFTVGYQRQPSVAIDADGDFVIAWHSWPQDGSGEGVYAQRYAVVPEVAASVFLFELAPQRLSFAFNLNVGASLGLDDLVVQALPSGPTVNPTSVSFDAATNTATFSFTGILPDANYRATLIGSGITGPSGTPMQQDHTFDFFFLSADANRDGVVNLADFNILAGNFGQSGPGIDFTKGDFNYDGVVNLADFNLLAARFGTSLGPQRDGLLGDLRQVQGPGAADRFNGGATARNSVSYDQSEELLELLI